MKFLVENLVLVIAAGIAIVLLFGVIFRAKGPRTVKVPAQPRPPSPPDAIERIGVVLVHGIGEQRRFQHLDSQMRDLLRALRALEKKGLVQQMSVDVAGSPSAAFAAEQDTWISGPGPSITVTVDHRLSGKDKPQPASRSLPQVVAWQLLRAHYRAASRALACFDSRGAAPAAV